MTPSSDTVHPVNTPQSEIPVWSALKDRSLFTRWRDPVSGILSYILTGECAAPLQQSFYYINPSLTDDGRFYWFFCAFPPSGDARDGRSLAVLDVEKRTVTHFPETHFREASPLVDRQTGEVYWCEGGAIYKRTPEPKKSAVLVSRLPDDFVRYRNIGGFSTHLTFSADRRYVNIDGRVGREWFAGRAPLDGGKPEIWQTFDRVYNHGQFSPTDPDLQLIAQDYGTDIVTGKVTAYENRLWLLRHGEKAEPVFARQLESNYEGEAWNAHLNGNDGRSRVADPRALHGHEWWDASGRMIWYIHYGRGVERVSLAKRQAELVWPLSTISHAHSSHDGKFLVGDNQPPQNPADSRVLFYNGETGRQVEIVSHIPRLAPELKPYHIDPHPQFCFGDELICYTTTVRGRVDVAFCEVSELKRLTG